MRRWLVHLRRTVSSSVRNDVLMLARAGAYSAMLCVFPIVLVTAAIIASSSSAEMVRAELHAMLYQMFPARHSSACARLFPGAASFSAAGTDLGDCVSCGGQQRDDD